MREHQLNQHRAHLSYFKFRTFLYAFYTLFAAFVFCSSFAVAQDHSGEVPAGLLRLGDGVLFPSYALVVDKSKKKIHVIDNSSGTPTLVQTFDSDLGKLAGDKHSTGDSRTPEGVYFLEQQLEGPGLDQHLYGVRAFVTNYPNYFDLRDGKSGYGIWLHAVDDKTTLERGSKGCVVVRNDTIKKISQFITLKETPLMIFDKVQWSKPSDTSKEVSDVLQFIGTWKKAWESKDINNYIGFYADDFKYGKMNKTTYKRFKADLAEKYKDIKINLSMPVLYGHNKNLVARFFQDYSSDGHTDFGEKTVYFTKVGDSYKIINEEWHEATDPKSKSFLAGNKFCCQMNN
jgi:murein L,D-transpeptidase YafK